jgi:hypothetical protein
MIASSMQDRSPQMLTVLREWGSRHVQWLTTIAVFCGTFAFSFGVEQPQMMLFTNAVLAGLSAFAGWMSYDHPRFALGTILIICCGAPNFERKFCRP